MGENNNDWIVYEEVSETPIVEKPITEKQLKAISRFANLYYKYTGNIVGSKDQQLIKTFNSVEGSFCIKLLRILCKLPLTPEDQVTFEKEQKQTDIITKLNFMK